MIAILIVSGLVFLFCGAEWLVRGASALALRFGISPLVIGLTVVAFGTSAPEMVVSIDSALKGFGDLAVGNVVGSNIFNIAFILGLSALVRPLRVKAQLLRFDVPIMIGISVLLIVLLLDSRLSLFDGLILTSGIVAYTLFNLWESKKLPGEETGNSEKTKATKTWVSLVLIAVGLGLLIAGARFLEAGAVDLARLLGVSKAVIGLTIVAAGTSLPELATSVVAGAKGHDDIAIGNIVGSNIFNILSILGISALIRPLESPGIASRDLLMMIAMAVILFPFMYSRFILSRIEGAILICSYAGYTYLLLVR